MKFPFSAGVITWSFASVEIITVAWGEVLPDIFIVLLLTTDSSLGLSMVRKF